MGNADTENLLSEPPDSPEMCRKHENSQRGDVESSHNEDLRVPRIMANKGKAAAQSHRAAKGPRILHRLFRVPAPRVYPPSVRRVR
jgi:hypothetical protein